jgi:hypothetical protein
MLNGQTFTHFSAHTAFPGTTGAGELSGGAPAYARKAVTINTATGGIRSLNASIVFDVAAGSTVRFLGGWNGPDFVGYFANGGATPKNFVAYPSTDTIGCPSHGYSDGDKVAFVYGTAPAGTATGTTYFVRDSATDSFKLAATSGGAAIDLTGAASTGCFIVAIREDAYVTQDTHTVSTTTIVWPD